MKRYIDIEFLSKNIDKFIIVLILPCFFLISYGIIFGLFIVEPDIQQKDAFRIIYVHVPSAYMSIFIYVVMGIMSFLYYVWDIKIADTIAKSSVFVGAIFTIIALLTGSIWGKPMWGTWWVWDARLTSELILLFLYFGYFGLRKSINNYYVSSKSCAILNMIGLINIPIIHYSVEWWYTLHQKATLSKFARPSIDSGMLYPLLSLILGFFIYYLLILFLSLKNEFLMSKYNINFTE